MQKPTTIQLIEMRWIAEFGNALSTAKLESLIKHGWAGRVDGQGRYGAKLTRTGLAALEAIPCAAKPAAPADPFDLIPGGGQ